jgi:hypothetical protein
MLTAINGKNLMKKKLIRQYIISINEILNMYSKDTS